MGVLVVGYGSEPARTTGSSRTWGAPPGATRATSRWSWAPTARDALLPTVAPCLAVVVAPRESAASWPSHPTRRPNRGMQPLKTSSRDLKIGPDQGTCD